MTTYIITVVLLCFAISIGFWISYMLLAPGLKKLMDLLIKIQKNRQQKIKSFKPKNL